MYAQQFWHSICYTHFTKPNPCVLQDPLFVYLIGTGFTETVRPVVLQPKHISIFQSHARSGISKLPPEVQSLYITPPSLNNIYSKSL